jgi:hypothetical protein
MRVQLEPNADMTRDLLEHASSEAASCRIVATTPEIAGKHVFNGTRQRRRVQARPGRRSRRRSSTAITADGFPDVGPTVQPPLPASSTLSLAPPLPPLLDPGPLSAPPPPVFPLAEVDPLEPVEAAEEALEVLVGPPPPRKSDGGPMYWVSMTSSSMRKYALGPGLGWASQ